MLFNTDADSLILKKLLPIVLLGFFALSAYNVMLDIRMKRAKLNE
jgi:hypothetical protein